MQTLCVLKRVLSKISGNSGNGFSFIAIFLGFWKIIWGLIFFFKHAEISSIHLFISPFYITVNNTRHIIFYSVCCLLLERQVVLLFTLLLKPFLKSSWNIKIEHLWQIWFEHISHFRIQGDLVVCGICLLISWWMDRKATKCTQYSTSSEDRWSQINSIPNQFLIC